MNSILNNYFLRNKEKRKFKGQRKDHLIYFTLPSLLAILPFDFLLIKTCIRIAKKNI